MHLAYRVDARSRQKKLKLVPKGAPARTVRIGIFVTNASFDEAAAAKGMGSSNCNGWRYKCRCAKRPHALILIRRSQKAYGAITVGKASAISLRDNERRHNCGKAC